jgi:hypothetical protein
VPFLSPHLLIGSMLSSNKHHDGPAESITREVSPSCYVWFCHTIVSTVSWSIYRCVADTLKGTIHRTRTVLHHTPATH